MKVSQHRSSFWLFAKNILIEIPSVDSHAPTQTHTCVHVWMRCKWMWMWNSIDFHDLTKRWKDHILLIHWIDDVKWRQPLYGICGLCDENAWGCCVAVSSCWWIWLCWDYQVEDVNWNHALRVDNEGEVRQLWIMMAKVDDSLKTTPGPVRFTWMAGQIVSDEKRKITVNMTVLCTQFRSMNVHWFVINWNLMIIFTRQPHTLTFSEAKIHEIFLANITTVRVCYRILFYKNQLFVIFFSFHCTTK